MKRKLFLLAGYCTPFVFLAMYGDARFGAPGFWVGYSLMILGLTLLCRTTIRYGTQGLLLIGNIISFAVSFICMLLFQTEKWLWYFSPLSAEQLLLLLSLIATGMQWLALQSAKKRVTNSDSERS